MIISLAAPFFGKITNLCRKVDTNSNGVSFTKFQQSNTFFENLTMESLYFHFHRQIFRIFTFCMQPQVSLEKTLFYVTMKRNRKRLT